MTINPTILDAVADVNAEFAAPCSVVGDWHDVGSPGYLLLKDADPEGTPITNPSGSITDSTRQIFRRDNRMGSMLLLRMRYTGTESTITSPVVQVFGRNGPTGVWQLLKNRLGDMMTTLQVDQVTDLAIGSSAHFTTPDLERHAFDTQGCDEFLIGVVTPFAPIPGPPIVTVAVPQVKIV